MKVAQRLLDYDADATAQDAYQRIPKSETGHYQWGPGLSYPQYIQSGQPAIGRMLINVDISTTPRRRSGPVCEVAGDPGLRRPHTRESIFAQYSNLGVKNNTILLVRPR
jgi:hypothetical protein